MNRSYYASPEFLQTKHEMASANDSFVSWVLSLVEWAADGTVLDLGCGYGRFAVPLVRTKRVSPERLVCADNSHQMLTSCLGRFAALGIALPRAVLASAEALPIGAACIDVAVANHLLDGLDDLAGAIRELRRVLRPGGSLVATVNDVDQPIPLLLAHERTLQELGVEHALGIDDAVFSNLNGRTLLEAQFAVVTQFIFHVDQREHTADSLTRLYRETGTFKSLLSRTDISDIQKAALSETFASHARALSNPVGTIPNPLRITLFLCR